MRLLAFSDVAPPEGSGGVERTLAELYPRLAGHGVRICLVTLGGPELPPRETRDGVRILRARRLPLERLTGAQTAASAAVWGLGLATAARFRPDLIHAHTLFYHTSLVAAVVARVLRVPLVLTLHLGAVDALPQPYRALTRAYERTAGRTLLAAAARIICVSHDVRRHALALGAPPHKLVVVPNGVDASRFAPRGPNHPAPNGKAEGRRQKDEGAADGWIHPSAFCLLPSGGGVGSLTLICTGRLIFNKGQQHLLDALAELHRRGFPLPHTPAGGGSIAAPAPGPWPLAPGLRLVLAGDGPMAGRLRRQAARLGLDAVVQFAGHRDDIEALLRAADIFVRPSLSDGMSLAVLEAMASGLPVIATDVSGTRQLIRDGVDGMVVPPGSAPALAAAIARLAAAPELRRRLGAAARQRALGYDWSKVAAATLEEMARVRA